MWRDGGLLPELRHAPPNQIRLDGAVRKVIIPPVIVNRLGKPQDGCDPRVEYKQIIVVQHEVLSSLL